MPSTTNNQYFGPIESQPNVPQIPAERTERKGNFTIAKGYNFLTKTPSPLGT